MSFKRKRNADRYESDGDVNDNAERGSVSASTAASSSTKRARADSKKDSSANGGSAHLIHHRNEQGDAYFELTHNRRVTLTKYGGRDNVDVREYYVQDGVAKPGKRGISLPIAQFAMLVEQLPFIEALLAERGVTLTRPAYEGTGESRKKKQTVVKESEGGFVKASAVADSDEQNEEESVASERRTKKANIEMTSDEDEG